MKQVILILFLICCAPLSALGAGHKHKSEAEIARMTPRERVDEYANEQAYHKYDLSDRQWELLNKYILQDGLAALPRITEIMDKYHPSILTQLFSFSGERFDAAWMLLDELDNRIARVRASAEGRRAIEALDRAINRMRAAGYGKPNQDDWSRHGRFELAVRELRDAKGVNGTADLSIKDTFRWKYKIVLSEEDLLAFVNFMVAHYPDYPSWSETDYFPDRTQINEAGNPLWIRPFKKPERFFEAYLEFKRHR